MSHYAHDINKTNTLLLASQRQQSSTVSVGGFIWVAAKSLRFPCICFQRQFPLDRLLLKTFRGEGRKLLLRKTEVKSTDFHMWMAINFGHLSLLLFHLFFEGESLTKLFAHHFSWTCCTDAPRIFPSLPCTGMRGTGGQAYSSTPGFYGIWGEWYYMFSSYVIDTRRMKMKSIEIFVK